MNSQENKLQIAAVVVTYNRKELLLECISAILSQTYCIKKIIIIDNASTDGTRQLLKEQGFLSNFSIEYHNMKKNIGGAGGFCEGIKIAKKLQPDWIWIMDDDTIPKHDCLENLVKSTSVEDHISFLASCVCGINGEPMNVPGLYDIPASNGYSDWYMNLKKRVVKIRSATFVSILINASAVDICGFPCKNFFIWGDDTEYTMRLVDYYGSAYLVGDSWVCHKRKDSKSLNISNINDKNRIKNIHYMVRNSLIISAQYGDAKQFIKRYITYNCESVQAIFESRNGIKKCLMIQKGILEFIFQYSKFRKMIDKELHSNDDLTTLSEVEL